MDDGDKDLLVRDTQYISFLEFCENFGRFCGEENVI